MLLDAAASRSACDSPCNRRPGVVKIREGDCVHVLGGGFLEGTIFGKSRKCTVSAEMY